MAQVAAGVDMLDVRSSFGKGSAKKLRKEGKTPCVITSSKHGAISVAFDTATLKRMMKNPSFMSTIFESEVALNGKNERLKLLPRKADFHPVTDNVLHVDFLHVSSETVDVEVPVVITGSDKSMGLKRGGKLNLVKYFLPLTCKIDSVPQNIEINIANFGIGRSLFLSGVKLPEGVKMTYDCIVLSIIGRGKKDKAEEAQAAQQAAAAPAAKPATAKN